jgi:hypothetical protein
MPPTASDTEPPVSNGRLAAAPPPADDGPWWARQLVQDNRDGHAHTAAAIDRQTTRLSWFAFGVFVMGLVLIYGILTLKGADPNKVADATVKTATIVEPPPGPSGAEAQVP